MNDYCYNSSDNLWPSNVTIKAVIDDINLGSDNSEFLIGLTNVTTSGWLGDMTYNLYYLGGDAGSLFLWVDPAGN